jgi:hypothetical protein
MINTPLNKEEDFFLKKELELLRKRQEEAEKKLKAEEKKRLKQLHHMRCPKCGMELTEIEFRSIRVDRCFSCGGTWFDAGEVEQALTVKKGTLESVMKIFKK